MHGYKYTNRRKVLASFKGNATNQMPPWYIRWSIALVLVVSLVAGYMGSTPAYAEENTPTDTNTLSLIREVDTGFTPVEDGYRFANWHGFPKGNTEFTFQDVQTMFGDAAAFASLTTCTPNPAAQVWLEKVNAWMQNGRCDGFSTTSLRFFTGVDTPASFQPDADQTHDLTFDTMYRHIAYYWALQVPNPVAAARYQALQSTPHQVLEQVSTALLNIKTAPVTLVLYNQERTAGHSVTPYAITQVDKTRYHIAVYDSYFPDDTGRFVEIDTVANTWRYQTFGDEFWSGNASTNTLGTIALSLYDEQPVCPWCQSTSSLQSAESPGRVETWFTGQSRLLIANETGERIGHDGATFVNTMADAFQSLPPAGLDNPGTPMYYLPSDARYTITLDSDLLDQPEQADITQFGPGYVVAVDDMWLEPSEQSTLTVAADGRELVYESSSEQDVTLMLVLDDNGESTRFDLRGVNVGANQMVRIIVDSANQMVLLDGSALETMDYGVEITRVTPDTTTTFVQHNLHLNAGERHELDYGAMDSADGAVFLGTAHGDDEVASLSPVKNQAPQSGVGLASTATGGVCPSPSAPEKSTEKPDEEPQAEEPREAGEPVGDTTAVKTPAQPVVDTPDPTTPAPDNNTLPAEETDFTLWMPTILR